jgi:hypothetical protein
MFSFWGSQGYLSFGKRKTGHDAGVVGEPTNKASTGLICRLSDYLQEKDSVEISGAWDERCKIVEIEFWNFHLAMGPAVANLSWAGDSAGACQDLARLCTASFGSARLRPFHCAALWLI